MLLPILVLACQTENKVLPETIETVPTRDPVALQTLHRNTGDELLLQARVVDEFGFALPNQTVSFLETEANIEEFVTSDAFGYATLKPQFTDGGIAEATVSWNGQTGKSIAVSPTTIPSFRGYTAQYVPTTQTPHFIVPMSEGSLIGYDTEIWWSPLETNGFPHLVGNLPIALQGITSGHIDKDGIIDAVAWSQDVVYFLRGAPNGGVFLVKEYKNLLGAVVNVSIDNLDNMEQTDIAIAMSTEDLGYLQVLKGDGAWGFEEEVALEIPFPIEAAVAADESGNGFADVSVVNGNEGTIHRYSFSIEGWVSAAHSLIDPSFYLAPSGTQFPPQVDLNADGNKDLLVYDGESSFGQTLTIFLTGSTLQKYVTENIDDIPFHGPYDAVVDDLDGSGYLDILALSNDSRAYHYYYAIDETGNTTFSSRTINTPNITGSLITYPNGDSPFAHLRVLSHQPSNIHGKGTEEGKWTTDLVYWKEDPSVIIDQEKLILVDADGDGNLEVAAIVEEAQSKVLRIYRYGQSRENLQPVEEAYANYGDVEIPGFAFCDGQFLTIVDDGTEKTLRATILSEDRLQTNRSTTVAQDTIDCATIDGTGEYLLFGGEGATTYSVINSTFGQVDSDEIGSFTDMALGLGEDGTTHTVVGCTETGCQIEMADLDGDGDEEVIVKNSAGVTIQGLKEDQTFLYSGDIDTVDIDQDGREELLIRDAETKYVWVIQAESGHISSVYGLWTDQDFLGLPRFGDIEGDGVYELGMVSPASTMITSQ